MLNLKFFSKQDIQKMQEIVDGKRELHKENKLYDRLYDSMVSAKTMPYDVQVAKTMPPMAFILEALDKTFKPDPKKKVQ